MRTLAAKPETETRSIDN